MRKYFVKRGGFANVYSLCHTDGMEPGGWERITRKEAEDLARAEARRQKEDPSFACYADSFVFPYEVKEEDCMCVLEDALYGRNGWRVNRRVVTKS